MPAADGFAFRVEDAPDLRDDQGTRKSRESGGKTLENLMDGRQFLEFVSRIHDFDGTALVSGGCDGLHWSHRGVAQPG
jgi:hypothetical protein